MDEMLCTLVKGVDCQNCPFGSIINADDPCPRFRSSTSAVYALEAIKIRINRALDQVINGEVTDR